jgi:hypothetical protein
MFLKLSFNLGLLLVLKPSPALKVTRLKLKPTLIKIKQKALLNITIQLLAGCYKRFLLSYLIKTTQLLVGSSFLKA